MGRLTSTLEHRGAFRPCVAHSCPGAGLLLDEKRAHCGGGSAADLGDVGLHQEGKDEQTALLTALIGGDDATAAARQLLGSLGSLSRVMSASREAIARIAADEGVAARIAAARAAVLGAQRESIGRAAFDLRDVQLQRYIIGLFNGLASERLHAVYLDSQARYITDEPLAQGGGAEVGGCLRPFVARAFELGSPAVVLAHNHPSGKACPSEADVAVTQRLNRSLGELEIALFDHLIVGGTTIYSMRGAGLL